MYDAPDASARQPREFAIMAPPKTPPYEVRCPMHGSIPFNERERAIIDHPLVQRLRFDPHPAVADRQRIRRGIVCCPAVC